MPAYRLNVSGPLGVVEEVRLRFDADLAAVHAAFSGCSTFGHSLWRGRRFLGHFEPGDGRLPRAVPPGQSPSQMIESLLQ